VGGLASCTHCISCLACLHVIETPGFVTSDMKAVGAILTMSKFHGLQCKYLTYHSNHAATVRTSCGFVKCDASNVLRGRHLWILGRSLTIVLPALSLTLCRIWGEKSGLKLTPVEDTTSESLTYINHFLRCQSCAFSILCCSNKAGNNIERAWHFTDLEGRQAPFCWLPHLNSTFKACNCTFVHKVHLALGLHLHTLQHNWKCLQLLQDYAHSLPEPTLVAEEL